MNNFVLDYKDPRALADDVQFCDALNYIDPDRERVYFDTAAVVKMLSGWDAVTNALYNDIKIKAFNNPDILITALGYNNWLGPIHLLPPHGDELTNLLLNRRDLFPEHPKENSETVATEFWHKASESLTISSNDNKNIELKDFQFDLIKIFKGIFLSKNQGFWKNRYNYLVKDVKLLQVRDIAGGSYAEITRHPLFNPILKFLNEKREKRQANNYLDAMSLCCLDEAIKHFDPNNTSTPLPILYSDQEHILNAARHFSMQREKNGRYPFTYRMYGKKFLIVRSHNFFVLKGLYKAIKDSAFPNLLGKYNEFLSSLRQRNIDEPLNEAGDNQGNKLLIEYVQPTSDESVVFNFLQEWINKEHDLKDVNDVLTNYLDKEAINNEDVEKFILEEQARQREQLEGVGDRISIIKGIWQDFELFEQEHKHRGAAPITNVYKEIGCRLYYSEKVCNIIQEKLNIIFPLLNDEHKKEDLFDIFANVVNDIASSLFQGKSDVLSDDHLEKLATGLGVLWFMGKYERIDQICHIIFERYSKANAASDADKYPSPSIALMHAISILKGNLPRQDHVLYISKCIDNKFGSSNYNIWLGLSFLNISIWRSAGGGFTCPEWQYYRVSRIDFDFSRKEHLDKALQFSKRAYDWLVDDEKKNRTLSLEKKRERQAKIFYASNNYLFMLSICENASNFYDSLYLAETFQDGAAIPNLWHRSRYSDTLACYYLRMTLLSKTEKEFSRNIERALYHSRASLDEDSGNDIYKQLNMKIEEVEEKGFSVVYQKIYKELYKNVD